MKSDFQRIFSLLRKERGLSQKSVADELGVSQALLSHYEKGIRECGLDFLVRAADFYGVSTDYLLGRSPSPDGMTVSVEEIPEPDAAGKENVMKSAGVLPVLNKKLIANSMNVMFDILAQSGSRELTQDVSNFLMLAVYRMFRALYNMGPKNQPGMFTIPKSIERGYADAAMQRSEADVIAMGAGEAVGGEHGPIPHPEALSISTERLSRTYPLFTPSLLNLIQNCENTIRK